MSAPILINSFRTAVRPPSPEDLGFKSFVVTDADAVEIPGIVSIEELRLNGHTIPQYVDHKVPKDSTLQTFDTLRMANYRLEVGPRGVPVLERSQGSNDGKWQLGSVVMVKGEWEDDAPAANADGLDALTKEELRAKATDLGITDFNDRTNKADLLALIRAKA